MSRLIRKMGVFVVGLFFFAALTPALMADQILATFDYGNLKANRPYQTSMTQIFGGRQYVNSIRITVYGNYCQLVSRGLTFIQDNRGQEFFATPDGRGGFGVQGTVFAINYKFEQTRWNNVDCRIELWSTGQGGIPDGGQLPSNIQSLASSLSINGNLLSARINLTDGYDALGADVHSLAEYVQYFYRIVEAGHSRDRVASAFRLVREQTNIFERKFVPVHMTNRNLDVEEAWNYYIEALSKIRL
ncbi:MAG: hypothetical protein NT027_01610 [Proteobacteria bacterium]|nr:hypothetical protein [Pseudomonadota bacterium]